MICPRDAELVEAQRIDEAMVNSSINETMIQKMTEDDIADRLGESEVTIVRDRHRRSGECMCGKCTKNRQKWDMISHMKYGYRHISQNPIRYFIACLSLLQYGFEAFDEAYSYRFNQSRYFKLY